MLKLDFGEALSDMEIVISFRFFSFGDELKCRPYIDRKNERKVTCQNVQDLFDFADELSFSNPSYYDRVPRFPRDLYYNFRERI